MNKRFISGVAAVLLTATLAFGSHSINASAKSISNVNVKASTITDVDLYGKKLGEIGNSKSNIKTM